MALGQPGGCSTPRPHKSCHPREEARQGTLTLPYRQVYRMSGTDSEYQVVYAILRVSGVLRSGETTLPHSNAPSDRR